MPKLNGWNIVSLENETQVFISDDEQVIARRRSEDIALISSNGTELDIRAVFARITIDHDSRTIGIRKGSATVQG